MRYQILKQGFTVKIRVILNVHMRQDTCWIKIILKSDVNERKYDLCS